MTDYGATDTSTTTLNGGSTQFPVNAVHVPNVGLKPVGGGPRLTDVNGKDYTSALGYVPDGNDVTQGLKADAAATDSTSAWSVIALLKGILGKLLGSIAVTGTFWQATQPVSGTVTANAGTNLNTSALALDATLTGGGAKSKPQVAGADVSVTNPMPIDGAAQQGPVNISAINGAGVAGPQLSATLNSGVDNTITFASKVRTIMLHNQSAVNVPYEHDIAAVAVSPYLAPGQLAYIDVHTTVLHAFPPIALPINAANGLIVRGWS